jgi:hypothetical protein
MPLKADTYTKAPKASTYTGFDTKVMVAQMREEAARLEIRAKALLKAADQLEGKVA